MRTDHNSHSPLRPDMKPIRVPSGDQVGLRSFQASSVRRTMSEPSGRIITISSWAPRLVQASQSPAGEGEHQPSDGLRTAAVGPTLTPPNASKGASDNS